MYSTFQKVNKIEIFAVFISTYYCHPFKTGDTLQINNYRPYFFVTFSFKNLCKWLFTVNNTHHYYYMGQNNYLHVDIGWRENVLQII